MLSEAEARALLARYVPLDQSWGAHSVAVARGAGIIAGALRAAGADVSPTTAHVAGLLHDIGRSETHDSIGHLTAGHHILTARGEPVLARVCLCHGFSGLTPDEATLVGWPRADYRPRTWEERAVTVADALTHGDRTVFLAERLASVLERYRGLLTPDRYTLLTGIEPKSRAIMAEMEALIGRPIEELCAAGHL